MTRRLSAGVLAAGLLAAMAPAGQAAAGTVPGRPVPAQLNVAAVARARAALAGHTGVVSGLVRSIGGSPASGACVTVLSHAHQASVRTGPDGRYLLGGLRPGQYHITAGPCADQPSSHPTISAYWTSGPASITVHQGQITNPAPISIFHLDPAALAISARQALPATASRGSISGRVTGNGRPLRGVCAVAFSPTTGSEGIAVTGKKGNYRITKLGRGRYDVVFAAGVLPICANRGNWLEQWYPGVNSPVPTGKLKAVRVRSGKDTGGIDGLLKQGGEISGTVRAKSGKPLPGICADVTGMLQGGFVGFDAIVITNKAGRYAARGLFPGRYQVEFTIGCGTKGNFATQWWRDAMLQKHARTIRITGTRQVTGVNATLLPGASVSGVVKAVNAAGKPLAGVCVTADGQPAFTMTGRHGGYRIIGLPAGNLTMMFDPTCNTGMSKFLIVQRSIRLTTGQTVTGFNVFLPEGGGISGVVTDAHGQPLGGICVLINDDNGDFTRTRPNGHYSLIGTENGSFQVQFTGGCGNTGSVAPQFYPNSPTSITAKSIRFRPNTTTPNINATMQPGATLTGRVTDTAGHPLSHICVDAFSPQSAELPIFQLVSDFAEPGNAAAVNGNVAAASGTYVIKNLAPGAYDISFGCGGFGTEFFRSQVNQGIADLLSVNTGTTRVPVTRLSRAGAITGTVTIKSGKALFMCVEVAPAGTRNVLLPAGFGVTDPNGHYRIGGLAPARYLVRFINCTDRGDVAAQWYRRVAAEAAATPVRVRPGRTDAGINAVMTAGGTISGRVTGPTGKPARAVCVTASSQQAQIDVFSETGRSGRYRLTGLSTGRWSLAFTPCGSPKPDLGSVTRPGTIRVTAPHTVTGVNIKLPFGGSVSGLITSKAGGTPVGNVCVLLLPVKANAPVSFAFTDGHGRYLASHLRAGGYRAYIADPNCDFFPDDVPPVAPQWYNGQPTQARATVVHVSARGTTTGIDGALTQPGAVTGVVDTPAHAPVARECVTAIPFRAALDPVSGLSPQQEVAVTSGTGAYTLTGLMPGRYKIEFSSGCGGSRFATQWWDNAPSATSAKVITVKFATIAGIDATLRK